MHSLFRRLYHEQEGQVIYLVAAALIVLLGMAALSIDIGFALHAQRELQASTEAAATAGANQLPNATAAVNYAWCFSGVGTSNLPSSFKGTMTCPSGTQTSGSNFTADLPGVQMVSTYPLVTCVNTLNDVLPCSSPDNTYNALQVKETVQIQTFFAKVLGFKTLTLYAQAEAAERSAAAPYNIAIVLDTTASMQSTDPYCTAPSNWPNSSASYTKEDCAKAGAATLLQELSPWVPNSSPPVALQEVSLLVFPGLTGTAGSPATNASAESDCWSPTLSAGNGIVPYTGSTDYEVVGLSNDFKQSDSSTSLNTGSSALANAVSWTNQASNCTKGISRNGNTLEYGLQDPGGEGTYYAGAITQAQGLFPTSGPRANYQDAVILLSDGDATASGSEISSSLARNECTQAVNAAHTLVNTYGTWVYAIAYDAQAGGCNGDSGYNACSSLQNIASSPGHIPDPAKFYSDSASARNGCSSENSVSDLSGIFGKIGMDFLTTRLVPWGTP
jgi:Flp pilus assembly protein TadG